MKIKVDFHFASERAFSIVELMIAIFLMTVILSIAVPAFQTYARNTNFRSMVREVSSDFFLIKERAISENRFYRISFNTANGTYTVEQGSSTGAPYEAVQTKNLTSFGDGITFTSADFGGVGSVVFQPRGTCDAGAVVLSNGAKTGTIGTYVTGKTYVQISP